MCLLCISCFIIKSVEVFPFRILSGKEQESVKFEETSKFLLDNENLVSLSPLTRTNLPPPLPTSFSAHLNRVGESYQPCILGLYYEWLPYKPSVSLTLALVDGQLGTYDH